MVLKKFRIKQKNSSGNYDTLHPETSADQVIDQATGKTVATHLAEKASLTNAGHVQLSNSVSGTSQTKAGTELAVKDAKEAAIQFAKDYGLGGPARQVTGNWNDHKASGLYMGNGLINEPPGGHAWKFITVMQHNENYVVQSAVDFDNTEKYTRALQNGVWSQWKNDGLKDGGFRGGAINFNDLALFRNRVFQIGDTTGSTSPPPQAYGSLVTHNPSTSGYATQIFTSVTTGDEFTRVTSNGGTTWTPWKQTAKLDGTIGKTAKGSYVGDNTNNRYFEVGFKPSLVFITKLGSTAGSVFMTSSLSTRIFYQSSTQQWADGSIRNAVAASGFYSSYNANGESANNLGATYEWIAIG